MYLQLWILGVYKTKLPLDLTEMMRIGRKYNARPETLHPTRRLQREMPVWHHSVFSDKQKSNNSAASKCLRNCHLVQTVGDAMDVVLKRLNSEHRHHDHPRCECPRCYSDKRQLGCKYPNRCVNQAYKMLKELSLEWNPLHHMEEDGEETQEPIDTHLFTGKYKT